MTTVQVKPALQLPTNRGLLKMILLGLITFGIYPIVVYSKISEEINLVASPHDGKHTTHYCLMYFIFSWLSRMLRSSFLIISYGFGLPASHFPVTRKK